MNMHTCLCIQSYGYLRDYTPKLVRSDFCYYLAGLIEGNGSIYVPKKRSVKGKKLYPSIQINFHLPDFPLCLLIRQKLKCGKIQRKARSHAYVFTINDFSGILQIIHLINGLLRTPKIYKFYKLIDFVNECDYGVKYPTVLQKKLIVKLPKDETSILENAWFSGFLEADGCFYVRITHKKPKVRVGFYLEQRMIDMQSKHSLLSIMEKISFSFSCHLKKLNNTKKEKKVSFYRVYTSSEKSNLILIEYLNKYNIFSSKYLNYKDWKKAFTYILQRKNTVKQILPSLIPFKQGMNSKRTFYNWDHLENFYT